MTATAIDPAAAELVRALWRRGAVLLAAPSTYVDSVSSIGGAGP